MTSIPQSVLVLGGGAKGGLMAARMHENGVAVTIMARPTRCLQIATQGLHVTSMQGRFRRPVPVVAPGDVNQKYGTIIVACRSHLLLDALSAAAPAMLAGTNVVSLVDGGPYFALLRRRYPLRPLFEGTFDGRVTIDADGIIRHRQPTCRIRLGADRFYRDRAHELAVMMAGRGLTAEIIEDFSTCVWTKSVVFAAGVGAMAVVGRPLRDALRLNSGHIHFALMAAEGRKIAQAMGVPVTKTMVADFVRGFGFEGEPLAPPPMPLAPGGSGAEAQFLLAQMVERAEHARVHVPNLRAALNIVERHFELEDAA